MSPYRFFVLLLPFVLVFLGVPLCVCVPLLYVVLGWGVPFCLVSWFVRCSGLDDPFVCFLAVVSGCALCLCPVVVCGWVSLCDLSCCRMWVGVPLCVSCCRVWFGIPLSVSCCRVCVCVLFVCVLLSCVGGCPFVRVLLSCVGGCPFVCVLLRRWLEVLCVC